jgi:hydroxyquinol 1,2-dioxygenase
MAYVTEENLTDVVMARWKDISDPRLREIIQALIKHLHGFVRDIEPTPKEWFTALEWLARTGKLCTGKRHEFILVSDVFGVSMLVDAINHRGSGKATPSTVEGPFHVPNAPEFENAADMAKGAPGFPCFVTGTVRGLDGEPVAGAMLDLWQTDGDGLYEDQREGDGPWMRGIYHSQKDGSFTVRTVVPIAYTIPMDGTVGELVNHTDISHMRPAHMHFAITAPGYRGVTTHLFRRGDKWLDTDVVYGVKEPLIVDFVEKPAGKAPTGETVNTPFYQIHYDFVLQKEAKKAKAA